MSVTQATGEMTMEWFLILTVGVPLALYVLAVL